MKKLKLIPPLIFMLSSGYFIFRLFKLNILPFRYECLTSVILVILCLLMLALSLRLKHKIGKYIIAMVNIILAISLFFGSSYLSKGNNALEKVSGANKKTYTMSLIVLNDSDFDSISDLKDVIITLNNSNDVENLNIAMEVVKAEVSDVAFDIQDTYKALVDNLYNGSVSAILINEAYRSMLEVEDNHFNEQTKVIWSYAIDSEVVNVGKEVDVTNTPFTIYVSGIDTYGSISTVSRTDVNMLLTVNPNTKEILLTSIPRDAWVELTNMQAYDKLTHSGIAGIENSVSTIENFLNIEINYYMRVNFSSLITLIDALGGIDVYSDLAYQCFTNKNVYIKKGNNHLDGTQALAYARERHAYDFMFSDNEQGDQMRVENQQDVMEATLKKLMSPIIIRNYSDIMNAVEGMFETNMSSSEITDLISMQIDTMSNWDIVTQKIKGHYEYRYGGAYMPDWHLVYYITDENSVEDCTNTINQVLNN